MRKVLDIGPNKVGIPCLYDEEKYAIEYNQANDVVIIRTAKEFKILKIFKPTINFVEQVEVRGTSYFVVSDYVEKKPYSNYSSLLKFYLIGEEYLIEKDELACELNDTNYEYIHLAPGSYVIEQYGIGGRIYSMHAKAKTVNFEKIFNINNRDQFKPISNYDLDTVFVERKMYSHVPEICDFVIYGIDPKTLKIKTSIYSFNQDRFIPLFTKEEIRKGYEILQKPSSSFDEYHMFVRDERDEIGEGTLNLAVIVPLLKKGSRDSNKDKFNNYTINPDFVKKLGVYPGEEK